ncbi:MAG TPA: hypothetical protein VF144_09590 [Chitinophagaceae bacterium]
MKQLSKILLAILFILNSCTTSRVTSMWTAPDVQQKKHKKILVLGLLHERSGALREKIETHIVRDLKNLGYDAICSCEEYDPKAFENMKEAEALQKLSGGDIDAVLTIILLNKTRERNYFLGRDKYPPQWWEYYSTMYERIYEPGYFEESTKYFWESNFYDLNSKELLYSAQTQSFDASSAESLANEYGKLIVNEMTKRAVLSHQKTSLAVQPM